MKYVLFLFLLFTLLNAQESSVASNVSYFEQKDISKEIDITKAKFQTLDIIYSNFGFTKSIFWIKVDLKNNVDFSQKYSLHIPYTLLDYIDIYEYRDNTLELVREYGDLREYKNDGFLPSPAMFVNIGPNESKSYYFKIWTQGSMIIELLVSEYDEYIDRSLMKYQALSFYFGAVIIMLLYNSLLFFFIRDRSYVYYISFHVVYLFFALSFSSIAFKYFWPELPAINSFAIPLFMSVASILGVLFTMDFLHLKHESPRLNSFLNIFVWINISASVLVFILSYYYSTILSLVATMLSIIATFIVSIYSHFALKNRNAKFFVLAWGMLLIGIFVVNLRNIGLLPVNIFTSYAHFIGAFFELTLLSLALAHRYNVQREEIALKDQAIQRQSRLAGMGEMINNIAHQWRQPLNRINLSLAVIGEVLNRESIDNETINQKIKNSQKNLKYMSDTIEDFSNFFKPDKEKSNFVLHDIIEKAVSLLGERVEGIAIDINVKENIELYGYKNEYLQVLLVILNNAIDNFIIKNIENKKIIIDVEQDKSAICVSITDNGGGIDKEYINFIFDPYFTTKFKKEGSGLGLYIAKMVIENSMNNELSVSSINNTTTFVIRCNKIYHGEK